jgi:UTP--glucose-1-phosphate uridylyltransferase
MTKEMLPVVDQPAIQYVVEEAVRAGLTDLLMITGRQKRALEDHFDRAPALERTLELKGDTARLDAVQYASGLGPIHYVRQGEAKGLGHAVLCARQHVGDEPFAVLLGDDLIDERDELLTTMMAVQAKTGGSVVALIEVDPAQISAYGCTDISAIDGEGHVRVNSLVEKPSIADAPSNLAVIGRYVLHPAVFDVLEQTEPGRGGEIQLTDALQSLATSDVEGGGVYGVVFKGRRYDTGDKFSYIKAVISIASERVDFGEDLKAWMKAFVS